MTFRKLPLLIALLLAVSLAAGCAGTTGGPPTTTPTPTPATTQPTMTSTSVPVTPGVDAMEPQPTVTPPNNWVTIITVARNPSTYQPNIIVTYGGGSGQYVLQELDVIVYHPDGSTQTASLTRPPGGSIPSQSTVTVPQTVNEPVRVQVLSMYSGIQYPEYDQVVPPIPPK
jgi:hypothetical protein